MPVSLIFQVSPDEKVIDKEEYSRLVEQLKKSLSEKELKVLALYLKGYSYKEISKILNITNKSIDNSLSRIKAKLKEKLHTY